MVGIINRSDKGKKSLFDLDSKKTIKSLNDLESLIEEERKRLKVKPTVRIIVKKDLKPIIINGLEIANYGTHGFPSMNNIALVIERCFSDDYDPITVICDFELRYLLVEHEKVGDLKKCDCLYCNTVSKQYYLGSGGEKVKFLECLPETDSDREILNNANNSGSQILTNKDYTEFRDDYALLSNKNWRISFKITDELVELF